jgi:cysteinyl-tRNA synthetase
MNITDIDDKIIKRARQNHLYESYIQENHSIDKILNDFIDVINVLEDRIKNTTDLDKKKMFQNMLTQVKSSMDKLELARKSNNDEDIKTLLEVIFACLHNNLYNYSFNVFKRCILNITIILKNIYLFLFYIVIIKGI